MTQNSIPPYFSWVVDKLLAVSALPFHHTHLNYLNGHGIHTIISFADDVEPPFHTKPGLKVLRLSVGMNSPPSINDCNFFVSLMENAKQRGEVCAYFCLILTV